MDGTTRELSSIEPEVRIFHNCDDDQFRETEGEVLVGF